MYEHYKSMVTSMSKPTKDDADLLLKIIAMQTADKEYNEATKWFFRDFINMSYDDFKKKYPRGSVGYTHIMIFCSYRELLGVMVNKDLLSEDLVFDMWGSLNWEKLESVIYGLRKDIEMPRFMENFEILAKKYKGWAEANPPKV